MKVERLGKYLIQPPKKQAFATPTPDSELRLPTLCAIVARKGSGKTVAIASKHKQLKDQNLCDRIFWISPTCSSNDEFLKPLDLLPEDIYHSPTPDSLLDVIRKIEMEGEEWKDYEEKMENYKKLQKLLKSNKPIQNIDPAFLLKCLNDDAFEPPVSKYGHKPILSIVLDDCQNTPIMTTGFKNPLVSLCLRHRHAGGGCGTSIWLCCQNFCSQGAGLPKSIRDNLSLLCLFRNRDAKVMQKIASEICQDVSEELFLKAYDLCTADDKHGFITVDMNPREKKYAFRRKWDELIIFDEEEALTDNQAP